jgi:hypothetical protein
LLLSDAKSYHINGSNVKELWLGGSKVWESIPVSVGLDGTGGFAGKTWEDVGKIVGSSETKTVFSIGDKVNVPLKNKINFGSTDLTSLPLIVNSFDDLGTSNTMTLCVDVRDLPVNAFCMQPHTTDTKSNYKSTQIRTKLQSDFLPALPDDLQAIIYQPSIYYSSYNSTIKSLSEDKILIPTTRHNLLPTSINQSSLCMDGNGSTNSTYNYKYQYWNPANQNPIAWVSGTGYHLFIPMFLIH